MLTTPLPAHDTEADVLRMFAFVSEGITAATEAFLGGDVDVARRLVAEDLLVNELQARIETSVEQELTSGLPIAPDRAAALIAVLRIVPELERTGDLVEHIALRTAQGLAAELTAPFRALIADMGRIAATMWAATAEAFVRSDASAAERLRTSDDALDDLHVSLTAQLAASSISTAVAIEMGLVARFYERLGDHAVNVARRFIGAPAPGDGHA